MSDEPDVLWRFNRVTPIGGDPTRGFVVGLATVADGKSRGGRGVDPEEVPLLTDYFRVEGLEKLVSPVTYVRAPASISSPAEVLDLVVERAKARKKIPSWVPRFLYSALPGGDLWDEDRAVGHPVLAICISRLATGALTGERFRSGEAYHHANTVGLRNRTPFEAKLVFRFEGRTRSELDPNDIVWTGFELIPSVAPSRMTVERRPGQADSPREVDSYQLPINDPVSFYWFIWELTRAVRPGL